jgi:L,D-transpeptidase ErfK/SrfK
MRRSVTSFFTSLSIPLILALSLILDSGSSALAASRVSDRILSFGIPTDSVSIKNNAPESSHYQWGDEKRLSPGSISLRPLERGRVRVASTRRDSSSISRTDAGLVDPIDSLEEIGRRVGDPTGLYKNFQIEVEKAKYSVKLFGFGEDGRKVLLFSCKAGLGSSEFPTPRGAFYIARIFDDKPLWIPPKDRDWAYGQSPSHSVYGGHMMPFYSRLKAGPAPKSDDINSELDLVAPQMKMVDTGAYRIHGTDSPWSVGSAQSHGCVRLLNSSVAQLSDTLKMYVGTTTRGQTPNGLYISLAQPVRLILY